MITEIVLFDLPKGMTRAEVERNFQESIPRWRGNPDLLRKTMIYSLESGKAGGVYTWNSVERAMTWHDEEFRQRILTLFGSEPSYQYFETPVVVDNASGTVIDRTAKKPMGEAAE